MEEEAEWEAGWGDECFLPLVPEVLPAEGNWYYQEKIGLCSGQERKTHSRKEFICKKVIRYSNRRGLNDFFFFFISLVIVGADRKWKARRVGDGHGK